MKLNTILIVNSIILFINSVVALLVPAIILSLYGVSEGAGEKLMAQYAGIGSLAIGILALLTRKIEKSEAKKIIILSIFVSDVIGVIISIIGTVNGIMNFVGWSLVAIYLFFTCSYGYFLFLKKDYFHNYK